jgi:hypothetical protein
MPEAIAMAREIRAGRLHYVLPDRDYSVRYYNFLFWHYTQLHKEVVTDGYWR